MNVMRMTLKKQHIMDRRENKEATPQAEESLGILERLNIVPEHAQSWHQLARLLHRDLSEIDAAEATAS